MRTIQQIENELIMWKSLRDQQREAIQNIAGLKKDKQLAELYIRQLEEELDAMME